MTVTTLDPPRESTSPSKVSLGEAALMMANHFESGLEKLSTIEAQAFLTWLQGAYLSIFLHVDSQGCGDTLLYRRIYRMIHQGANVLMSSELSSVSEAATKALQGFQWRAPQLDSRDLFSLAARLDLGYISKMLFAWVDLAYGNKPQEYKDLVYFAVRADGTLHSEAMPSASVPSGFLTNEWRRLPPFWRIVYVISLSALPYSGAADCILNTVISASALPVDRSGPRELLFPNYVAILFEFEHLFNSDPQPAGSLNQRDEVLKYRLFKPWEGLPVKGVREAENWIRWINESITVPDGNAFYPGSRYQNIITRFAQNLSGPKLALSFEAIDPNAEPSPSDKDTDEASDEPKSENDNPNPPEKTETPNPEENLDATKVTSEEDEPEQDNNNSIGDITLEQDSASGSAYLYRRAVLSLDDTLARDPNVNVSQDVRQALHLWCRDWLWLASVSQTHKLIQDLGLQKTLGPIAKEGLS